MTLFQRIIKRCFDFTLALLGLILFSWLIILCWLIASVETRSNGFFVQQRIGRHGKPFKLIKIKTMKNSKGPRSSITAQCATEITRTGAFFRRFKLDELPQLIHVVFGQMSLVGPRPDVAGYADKLQGNDRIMLELRPGITGPASIKYRNEEYLLSNQANPKLYNDTVIWPDKVKINIEYYKHYSLLADLKYLKQTLIG